LPDGYEGHMTSRIASAACLALAPLLLAASPSPKPKPSATAAPVPKERAEVTHGSVRIHGTEVAYTATAGTLLLYDNDKNATASVFYVAYTAGNSGSRPITFCYNGGPGSSSIWLHMGAFGPRRVAVPEARAAGAAPYQLVENEDSLLDRTDLVFVDAVGTGYSQIVGKGKGEDFYGVDADASAFSQFIRRYLSHFGRWNSPKYLLGESYGTTRSAVLSKDLLGQGVALNGVTLVSSFLDFAAFDASQSDDMIYWLNLPSEAAVAVYHHKLPNPPSDLTAFLREVRTFAQNDYATALAQGTTITPAARTAMAERLHRYMGIPTDYIDRSFLRVPPWRFEKELLGSSDEVIGRFDARYRGPTQDPLAADQDYDPSDTAISSAYIASFNAYITSTLHYNETQPYKPTNYSVGRDWKFTRSQQGVTGPLTEVTSDLTEAMIKNPSMRVFSANGLYDLATPFFATEYSLNHMGYNASLRSRITFGYYPAGHMIYSNSESHAALTRDLDKFYDETR
jgi:carboxypeptidase C (cathepsin A)